jgi:hypothetical protein
LRKAKPNKPTPEPQELPTAVEAFEDYYKLGPQRSLPKLEVQYRSSTEAVPTKYLTTLKQWSTRYGWQQRIRDRITEEEGQVRAALQEQSIEFRKLLAEKIFNIAKQADFAAANATDLSTLTKLYYQLTGQPLADKIEQDVTYRTIEVVEERVPLAEVAGADEDRGAPGAG